MTTCTHNTGTMNSAQEGGGEKERVQCVDVGSCLCMWAYNSKDPQLCCFPCQPPAPLSPAGHLKWVARLRRGTGKAALWAT